MSYRDAGVVVTGAGGGIGRAIVARLVAEGARVVASDVPGDELASLGREFGVHVVAADLSTGDGVEALVAAAQAQLGEIDAFVGNAGTDAGRGLDTPDEVWGLSWSVNVMQHVRAMRLLAPGWVARGRGRYVVTASAAGLLTMLEAAPYSVTKHGAVAIAEWLRATYGHRGIVVQAICPQGVKTRMYDDAGPLKELLGRDRVVEPAEVADLLVEAAADDRFLILPHPQVADYYVARAAEPDRWLAGMSRVQAKLDQLPRDAVGNLALTDPKENR